jgi:hypothetical protein
VDHFLESIKNPGSMTDARADQALCLAQQTAAASKKFDIRSPEIAKLAALASIALSLTQITEAVSQRTV